MKENNIKVSVVCVTYNHEKYIEDALKSFAMQETNFDFEVIVHDDVSTDRTKLIIEKYASKYDFIKPIYEIENQFSKGVKLSDSVGSYISGKYIAYCEGDDYWTDPLKLQKQYDFMETHPDCSLCGHSYIRLNMRSGESEIIETKNKNGIISVQTLIDGKSLHVNTVLFRNIDKSTVPSFFNSIKTVGDYPMVLYYATKGNVCYLNDTMSVYRMYTENSWTSRVSENAANSISYLTEMYSFVVKFNHYTNDRYYDAIQTRLQELEEVIGHYLGILKEKYELEEQQESVIEQQKSVIKEQEEIIISNKETLKNNDELIKNYKDIINNNKTTLSNHIETIESNSKTIDISIQEINKLLECRPYKIANKVHNCFSKIDVNKDILREKINRISDSIDDIKNKIN